MKVRLRNLKTGNFTEFTLGPEHVLEDAAIQPPPLELPPTHWRDVTDQVDAEPVDRYRFHRLKGDAAIYAYSGYRLRKVELWQSKLDEGQVEGFKQVWAFIVERKVD